MKCMVKIQFAIAVWKEGKHYVAQCLNVDVSSFGGTEKKALQNLKEALALYLEDIHASKIARIKKPSIEIYQQLVHV